MIRAALRYAELGHRVLPLHPGEKEPLLRHGVHQASDDERVLEDWWRRWPRANVGVACLALLVIDLDARHDGEAKWIRLRAGRELPHGPVARTATGGVHLLFRRPDFATVGKLVQGVDVLCGWKYFVAAPSVRSMGRYVWEVPISVGVPEAPAWLLELVRRPEPKPAQTSTTTRTDKAETIEKRARSYLQRMGPAISGQDGQRHTFHACQILVRGFALDASTAWALLTEWNAGCQPPWSERDLKRKLDQAIAHGQMACGSLLEDRRAA